MFACVYTYSGPIVQLFVFFMKALCIRAAFLIAGVGVGTLQFTVAPSFSSPARNHKTLVCLMIGRMTIRSNCKLQL